MKKISVAVLYGGRSGEHEVSLISAASVMCFLDRDRYEIIPLGITRTGEWYCNPLSEVDPLAGQTVQVKSPGAVPFSATLAAFKAAGIEVVFPLLHGSYGEDGRLQGYLEWMNMPYVGAGVLGSAVCMDKVVSKQLAASHGIPVGPYWSFLAGQWHRHPAEIKAQIGERLTFPVFVKPANNGSSVGINKVKNPLALKPAIEEALQYDTKIIVEQGLTVREIELSVLESTESGEEPLVSVPGEIRTTHEFYSYEAKYLDEKSLTLEIPAQVTPSQLEKLTHFAKKLFVLLGCHGMARADFFLEIETGEILFNELNTLPGFTTVSMYPKLWEASGLSYPALLDQLLKLALARTSSQSSLCSL